MRGLRAGPFHGNHASSLGQRSLRASVALLRLKREQTRRREDPERPSKGSIVRQNRQSILTRWLESDDNFHKFHIVRLLRIWSTTYDSCVASSSSRRESALLPIRSASCVCESVIKPQRQTPSSAVDDEILRGGNIVAKRKFLALIIRFGVYLQ